MVNTDIIIPPADITKLEQKMRPGVLSAGGFLGYNEKLTDVIISDNNTLSEIGVSHKQIASKMSELIAQALSSKNNKYKDNNFGVKVRLYTGFQICPWSENIHQEQCNYGTGVRYGSVEWIIKNREKRLEITGSGLLVHLIGDHHFFEGKGSPFRIEPKLLCSLLNLIE